MCYNFNMSKSWTRKKKRELIRNLKLFLKKERLTKLTLNNLTAEIQKFPNGTDSILRHRDTYAELYQKGTDKGTAIRKFCEFTGADFSQSVCFGDSMNDIGMFRVAPVSVAMKNAPEEIKSMATYVAQGEYGVAEGLKWLFGDQIF